MVWQFFTTLVVPASNITSSGGHSKSIALFSIYTANDRLNALSVYLKIQNFKGAIIREGRLIKRGVVYFKMHKVRKQKITFSGGHSHTLREESNAEKSPAEQKNAELKECEFGPKFAFFYSAFFGSFG